MSDSPFDEFFGPKSPFETRMPKKKVEKGVPWKAKIIDGIYYVPLEQVAELLEENYVLPKVQRGIEIRVRDQALKNELGVE